jgi:hypothetical protein
MKVYYAHCLEIYGKEQEKRDIATLKALGFEVINPSEPVHVEGYRREGMNYFTQLIENQADALAFRATASGLIPAGVAKEIEAARRKYVFKGNEPDQFGIPVFEIPTGILRRSLSVDETKEYLRDVGVR